MEILTIELLAKAGIAIVSGLISLFAHKLNKSTDIKISSQRQQQLKELAIDAVGYAAEVAAREEKANRDCDGEEKLAIAKNFMCRNIQIDRESAADLIISALAKIENEGSTGVNTIN